MQVLREEGSLRLEVLLDRVAERAMREEQARGGWEADVALWGHRMYRKEARQAVRKMMGSSLTRRMHGPSLDMVSVRAAEQVVPPPIQLQGGNSA